MKKHLKKREKQPARKSEERYRTFFKPNRERIGNPESDNQSLEQPWFLDVVPSVTTYGISQPAIVR
jgi:hypothetical protein